MSIQSGEELEVPPTLMGTWPTERAGNALCAIIAVLFFCAATVLLIAAEWIGPGVIAWLVSAVSLYWTSPTFRSRLGILLGCIGLLAFAPINTDRSTFHFLHLGAFFAVAVILPAILMHVWHPGTVDWRFWPRGFQWVEVFYVGLSIPLAWAVIHWYFFDVNPFMPKQWPMPSEFTQDAKWRLIIGINAVGIWDELFFINTVYAILRSILPRHFANWVQAVVYTSVLYNMAFIGIGPVLVYIFALTQGAMYERSKCLFYVLIVHLIVDAFLVAYILKYYYGASGIVGF